MNYSKLIKGKKYIAAVVPHTHWDRAWYWPFEMFRLSLVKITRELLNIMERDPRFSHFTFDGQTVVLEDHLAVFPEDKTRFEKLIKAGRLTVGPFYIQPDNTLISGESLIRNGIIGRKVAMSFGRCSRQGMAPDPFGMISQLPQIWNGLGLESVVFSRGIPTELVNKLGTVFTWNGSDKKHGVMAVFQAGFYGNMLYWGIPRGEYPAPDPDTEKIDLEHSVEQSRKLIKINESFKMATKVLYFGNGVDHFPPQHTMPDVLEYNAKRIPEVRFVVTDSDGMVSLIKQEKRKLNTFTGEIRYQSTNNTLNGTLDSRPYLKQQYDSAAEELEKRAEPLTALSKVFGLEKRMIREEHHFGYAFNVANDRPLPFEVTERSFEYLWKLLLKNAPHDDICGCSRDATHEDAENRAKRVNEAARLATADGLLRLARAIRLPAFSPVAQTVVFNPLPFAREYIVKLNMRVPSNTADLKVLDSFSVPAECTVKAKVTENDYKLFHSEDFIKLPVKTVTAEVEFKAKLPAFGYNSYYLAEGTPLPVKPGVKAGKNGMENEFLKVKLNSDGTFNLLDKATGTIYKDLNKLTDKGDAGDLYLTVLTKNGVVSAKKGDAKLSLLSCTPFEAVYKVTVTLKGVFEGLNEKRTERAGAKKNMSVAFFYTLAAGSREVKIRAEIDNIHRDHRLTVDFPTGLRTEIAESHMAFDVVKHKAPFLQEACMNFVTAAAGGKRLTVLSKSMHAYDTRLEKGKLILSKCILKASGWVNKDLVPNWEAPGGDCVGRKTVQEYAVMPGKASDKIEDINNFASAFAFKPVAEYFTFLKSQGDRPGTASFLKLPAAFEVSALKLGEDGKSLIVRVVNMSRKTEELRLDASELPKLTSAYQTNMLEERGKKLYMKDNVVTMKALSREIITIELK